MIPRPCSMPTRVEGDMDMRKGLNEEDGEFSATLTTEEDEDDGEEAKEEEAASSELEDA